MAPIGHHTTPNQSSEILILKTEMLLEFQNKTNIWNYWAVINTFWIRLRIARYRFVKYRFIRYTLKTSWKRKNCYAEDVFKTFSWHVCWTRLQGMSWRRLEDVFKTNKCLRVISEYVFRQQLKNSQAATRGVLWKKVFLRISQENIRVGVPL